MTSVRWIDLDGAVNVRDLAGTPTADGHEVQPHRLIRSDNLQGLTEADVRRLVDEMDVRSVVDLRTGAEVRSEGPGPLLSEDAVEVRHLSLFPETGEATDVVADSGAVVLPWQDRDRDLPESDSERWQGVSGVYLSYLADRPDSVVAALRTIASSDGATIVHCAAGKDRTGVVVAFALAEVGVPRDEIIADYARTAERIEAIMSRLRSSNTYRGDVASTGGRDDRHSPRAETMRRVFAAMDENFGGVATWLRGHGWTEDDAAALRAKLLD